MSEQKAGLWVRSNWDVLLREGTKGSGLFETFETKRPAPFSLPYSGDTASTMLWKLVRMIGLDFSRKSQLMRLLVAAESKLRALGNKPVWSSYESGPAIADFVAHARRQIENDAITQAEKSELWGIFAPTCDWDDVVGDMQLGNDIFSILDTMYRNDVHFPNAKENK